jgi:hypothetical protein
MDPALFYGSYFNFVSRPPHDGYESEDSDMSDDEAALNNSPAPHSDYEPNSAGQVTSGPTAIPDSDTHFVKMKRSFHSNKDCRPGR